MMKSRTQHYILQGAVQSYNQPVNRSLGKAPASISKDNEGESRLKQYLLRHAMDKTKKKHKNIFNTVYERTVAKSEATIYCTP